ncbi:MAG: shikimate dehydrogenase [Alphaproteobacteria bacterium]
MSTKSPSPRAFVIGWPIDHSRSPLIHGHWLETYKIQGTYQKQAVAPPDLAEFFETVRQGSFVGGNVTLPHKTAALALSDERDRAADRIGAANTLVVDNGRILARNTDGAGFIANLNAGAPAWQDVPGPAVVLGAGGAAKAVVWSLLDCGVEEIRVVNRTRSRAQALADNFGKHVHPFDWRDLGTALKSAGLLVNTTSLGMHGAPPLALPLADLPIAATVCDIVYAPLTTQLLRDAHHRGNQVVDGLGMLLHQAVPGFAAWFGVTPQVTQVLRDLVVADIEQYS